MSVYLIDTETTGRKDPQVIQLAWMRLTFNDGYIVEDGTFNRFYRPSKEIELGALCTHHISLMDLIDCDPSDTAKLPSDAEYIIGHNVDFDWKALGQPNVKRICTQALARHLWPNLDSHKLGACLYHVNPADAKATLKNAHDAEADCCACLSLFLGIVDRLKTTGLVANTAERLWLISEAARIPKIMAFGKYKGEPISSVPPSYMNWYRQQDDPDPYLLKAFAAVSRGGRK